MKKILFLLGVSFFAILAHAEKQCDLYVTATTVNDEPVKIALCSTEITKLNGKIVRYLVNDIEVNFDGAKYFLADYLNLRYSTHYICDIVKHQRQITGSNNSTSTAYYHDDERRTSFLFSDNSDPSQRYFLKKENIIRSVIKSITCEYLAD